MAKATKKTVKTDTPAKKAAVKKATKKATKKEAKKVEGLRKPQVRLLTALSKAKNPLIRAKLAEAAKVDQASCVEYLGSHNPDKRAANDIKHFPSLLSLNLVKAECHDEGGKDQVVYSITAAGRAKL